MASPVVDGEGRKRADAYLRENPCNHVNEADHWMIGMNRTAGSTQSPFLFFFFLIINVER
jgi:hypothetical protein